MEELRLKPCPFCGQEVAITPFDFIDLGDGWVFAHGCLPGTSEDLGVSIRVYGSTEEQVVERWNTRAGEG